MDFRKTVLAFSVGVFVFVMGSQAVLAGPLLGNDFAGFIYDVDPASGAGSNPRDTGIQSLNGIALSPTGTLYGLSSPAGNPPNSLLTINVTTGASTLVGSTGLNFVSEGDLDFNPVTGVLYGAQEVLEGGGGKKFLFTINPGNGVATIVGSMGNRDMSAIAFASDGTLYGLDTRSGVGGPDVLVTIDPADAQILTVVVLSINLGSTAGMDFDPATGILYVADGNADGTNRLYTLNTTTGGLSLIGDTGLPEGLAGLAFLGGATVAGVPTVSGWGLAIIMLLLLTGMKIKFGRRLA